MNFLQLPAHLAEYLCPDIRRIPLKFSDNIRVEGRGGNTRQMLQCLPLVAFGIMRNIIGHHDTTHHDQDKKGQAHPEEGLFAEGFRKGHLITPSQKELMKRIK